MASHNLCLTFPECQYLLIQRCRYLCSLQRINQILKTQIPSEPRQVNSRAYKIIGSSWVMAATQFHQMLFGNVVPE